MLTFKEFIEKKEIDFEEYLFEGIDVDVDKKIVYFNDKHENYVDTSLKNPTQKSIKGIDTYMLFKRKPSKTPKDLISDGNPLVYALKNTKGWKIPKKDEESIYKRINEIVTKLQKKKNFDTIILVPSSNPLVENLSNYLKGNVLEGCLTKRTKDEIIEDMPWQNFTKTELEKVKTAFDKMSYWFESKYFPKDQKIIQKMEVNLYKIHKDKNLQISGKHVLVVDDTISTGLSISKCSEIIQESYFPASITQLSLFSDL